MATLSYAYQAPSGGTIYMGLPAPVPPFQRGMNFGDSITSFSYASDPFRHGGPLTRHQPPVLFNYGVPNDTLQDMLNRQSTAISAGVGAGVDFVMLRAGTNGPGGGDFATKYATLVDAFVAAGMFVFCSQIPPYAGSDQRPLNTIVESICAARPETTLYVADCDGMATTGYQPAPGMMLDGIHPAPLGQYTGGAAQAPILDPYFTVDPRVKTSGQVAAQWVINPLMTGTGGGKSGGTGTVPDNWSVVAKGGGTSFVASIVAADVGDPVQVPWLRIDLASCGGSNHQWLARASMVHPAILADFADCFSVDTILEVRTVGLDCSNLFFMAVGPEDATETFIQASPQSMLSDIGTLNDIRVMRSAYRRNGPASYSANTLKTTLQIMSSGSFVTSAGYVDIRCGSAVGFVP